MITHGFLPLLIAAILVIAALASAYAHNGVRAVEWAFGSLVALFVALFTGATPTDLLAVATVAALVAYVAIGVAAKLEGALR